MKPNHGQSISPIDQIISGDPLLEFVIRHNISAIIMILLGMLYALIYVFILPAILGILNQVLDDWAGIFRAFIITSLVPGYYVWQPTTIQRLYNAVENRSLDLPPADLRKLSMLIKPFGNKLWIWLAIAFGILQSIIFFSLQTQALHNWQNAHISIVIMRTLRTFLTYYMIFYIVVRQVIAMIGINKFFRSIDIEIYPLHPDGAGGLKPLGQYVVTCGLGIGIIGLVLGMSLLRSQIGLERLGSVFYFNLGLYILFAPIFLFIPLIEAHREMQSVKTAILLDVAEQHESVFQKSLVNMRAGKSIHKELSELDSIRKMYTIADSSPEWPFDLNILSKFSAAVFLPVILPIVINYLADLIIDLIS